MHFPRFLLAVVSAAVLVPSATAQTPSQITVNLPRTVRMCGSDGRCQILSWNDGHYDGRMEGQTEVGTIFEVARWDREAVELTGIISKPDQSGNYATGIFAGKISGDGHGVENGVDTFRGGTATGLIPFTLSWNPGDQVVTASSRIAHNLPTSMRLCSDEKCIVMKLNGRNYDIYEENDPINKTAVCKVSSFSSDSVFLEFSVPNGLRALITGKVQGETVADAKLTWLNGFNGATAPLRIGWGDSLNKVSPLPPPRPRPSQGEPT
jgi:hypothetical protein